MANLSPSLQWTVGDAKSSGAKGLLPDMFPLMLNWNTLVAELTSQCGSADFYRLLECGLREWLSFDAFFVFEYDDEGQARARFHNLSGERKVIIVDEYVEGQYRLDPFYLRLADGDPAEASRGLLRLEVARAGHECDRYYRQHYRHTGIRDEIGFAAEVDGRKVVASITRPQSSSGFGSNEYQFCAAIAPVIGTLIAQHPRASMAIESKPLPPDAIDLSRLGISPRETEVVAMILEGHGNPSIALNLGISPGTVKIHRKNIYRKLGISNQGELFSLVFRPRKTQ